MSSKIQPLQVLDKCIGEKVWVIMSFNKEFVGVLKGFDEYLRKTLLLFYNLFDY